MLFTLTEAWHKWRAKVWLNRFSHVTKANLWNSKGNEDAARAARWCKYKLALHLKKLGGS